MEDASTYSHSPAHLDVAGRDHLTSALPRLPKAGDVNTESESTTPYHGSYFNSDGSITPLKLANLLFNIDANAKVEFVVAISPTMSSLSPSPSIAGFNSLDSTSTELASFPQQVLVNQEQLLHAYLPLLRPRRQWLHGDRQAPHLLSEMAAVLMAVGLIMFQRWTTAAFFSPRQRSDHLSGDDEAHQEDCVEEHFVDQNTG